MSEVESYVENKGVVEFVENIEKMNKKAVRGQLRKNAKQYDSDSGEGEESDGTANKKLKAIKKIKK